MERKRSDRTARARRAPSGAALPRASVTDALTRALFVEWAERGYGALSLERVAARAGVGKAALYRRWPSKLAMITERLETLGIELAVDPDTGSMQGDVRALLEQLRRVLRHPLIGRILPDLHAEMLRSPELAAAVRGRLQGERRRRGENVLRRAVERGEISPDIDVELINDALAGMIYWRMIVTARRADARYLDGLASAIVALARSAGGPPPLGRDSAAART